MQIHDDYLIAATEGKSLVGSLLEHPKFKALASRVTSLISDHELCYRWIASEFVDASGNPLIPEDVVVGSELQVESQH